VASHPSHSAARIAALIVPPLAMMALIFVLSGQPSDNIDRAWWDVLLRKVAHVTEYAVLTALWWRALRSLGVRRPILAAIAISLAYAATDEYHQTFIEGRHGTPVDVLIDSIGMSIAAFLIWRLGPPPDTRSLAADRGVREGLERAR
jgi:VanZ family protein